VSEEVLLGLSGGVDSIASAVLLKERGYDVRCVTFYLHEKPEPAFKAAKMLEMPIEMVDLRDEFKSEVIDYMVKSYNSGFTPNPCVVCNPRIKWHYLLKSADQHNIKKVSTGHYAKKIEKDGKYWLARAKDISKDQSYFLYRLDYETLERVIFPLAETTRLEAEKIIEENDFLIKELHKSRDLCFLSSSLGKFLQRYIDLSRGDIIHIEEGKIGEHNSIESLTVGQRRGLGITWDYPLYIVEVDIAKGRAYVGPKEALMRDRFKILETNWITEIPVKSKKATVRIRNTHPGVECNINCENGICDITLKKPQAGITPGQSAVFYDGEIVLGGGKIRKSKICFSD
jgi:tRNA-specific 2-thiouridylase